MFISDLRYSTDIRKIKTEHRHAHQSKSIRIFSIENKFD